MYQKSKSNNTHRAAVKAVFLVFILLLAIFPLFGDVRSARSRTIQNIGEVVTTRYANFQTGTILTNPLIEITIRNNNEDSDILFMLNISFGGTWSDHNIEVGVLQSVEALGSIEFTNTKIISDYIDGYFPGSYSGSEGFIDEIGISDISEISKMMDIKMPEGKYSITLTAYEVYLDEEKKVEISPRNELEQITIEFKVVNIGDLSSITTPKLDDMILEFRVPEIPVYDGEPSYRTTTKIAIFDSSNSQKIYTSTAVHEVATAGTSDLKGYPSDTDNGLVEYDLRTVKFRAGESYTTEITYVDWNNSPITSITVSFSFPTPAVSLSVDASEPLSPELSWDFSGNGYTDWVYRYDVYVNGVKVKSTTDNSYIANSLLPGTLYKWYVIPINRDGSAFYSGSEAVKNSFTTPAHEDFSIAIDSPITGDILIVGESYSFEATPGFSDGASLNSAQWTIGSSNFSGLSLNYTPVSRRENNSLTVNLSATDSLNLTDSAETVNVTVLKPEVSISGSTARNAGLADEVDFSVGTQQDVVTFTWYVDGTEKGTGEAFSFTFTSSGSHSVKVAASTVEDMNGNTITVESDPVTVTAVGTAPIVNITNPETGVQLPLGNSVIITATIDNQNLIKSREWKVDGTTKATSGDTFTFTPSGTGTAGITLRVTDEYDLVSESSIQIVVFNPVVSITNITSGGKFPLNSDLSPNITAPNAKETSWFFNGVQVSGSSVDLADYGVGTYQLYAKAVWDIVDQNGNPGEYEKETNKIGIEVIDTAPPEVSIEFPGDSILLKTGEKYTFSATAESDSFISDRWWVIDGTVVYPSSDGTVFYTPPVGMTKKRIDISFGAMNTNGIQGLEEVQVQIADPDVFLSQPGTLTIPVGSTAAIQAVAVDAELYWLIDGTETDSWNKIFTTAGDHTVQAGWKLNAIDGSGSEKEFSGVSANSVDFSVFSETPPAINSFQPSTGLVREKIGEELTFSVTASSNNGALVVNWDVTQDGTEVTGSPGGTSFSYIFTRVGTYTVQANIKDDYGYTTSRVWTVKIIDPSIAVTTPEKNVTYGFGSVPDPVVETQDLTSYYLSFDGSSAIADGYDWKNMPVGTYDLTAVGEYTVSSSAALVTIKSISVRFDVKNLSPPDFTLEGISSGDRIVAGEAYHFIAAPIDNDRKAQIENSIKWYRDGDLVGSGAQYDFTPTSAGMAEFICQAKLNGVVAEQSFTVEVLDPFAEITLPESVVNSAVSPYPILPTDVDILLQHEIRDIDRAIWNVDGTDISGQSVQINSVGVHVFNLNLKLLNIRKPDGSYGEFEPIVDGTTSMDRYFAALPAINSLSVENSSRLYTDAPLKITVDINLSEEYLIDSIVYSVDGSRFAVKKSSFGDSVEILNPAVGNHTISVEIIDIFGRSTTREIDIVVYKKLSIEIEQPVNGLRFSPDDEIPVEVRIVTGAAEKVAWSIDGTSVSGSDFLAGTLGQLNAGTHKIEVVVTDNAGSSVTDSVSIEVESDFSLNLLTPDSAVEIIIGNSLTCRVGVEKVGKSTVNLQDAATHISWYVNNKNTGETGLTYTYPGETVGDFSVYAKYEKGTMERTTSEQTITIRDIAVPKISSPGQGEKIIYTMGQTIPLKASGEPGAAFTWMMGSKIIAMGKEAVFTPDGLTGDQEIKLLTSAYGRTKEQLVTVNLQLNNPPEVSLVAPNIQYTGDAFEWTASTFDVDTGDDPIITVYLDGTMLTGDQQHRQLTESDIGKHSLKAKAVDKQGIAVEKQIAVEIQSGILDIEIQSPIAGDAYLKQYEIPLIASLETTNGEAGTSGSFRWTLQYLDSTSAEAVVKTGESTGFTASEVGEIFVLCEYFNAAGKLRGSSRINIEVENEPVKLGIYWPHGTVVNAEQSLLPQVTGLPAGADAASIEWSLDGSRIDSLVGLTAPAVSGSYILSAQYSGDGSSPSIAKVQFTVNGAPKVVIVSPKEGALFPVGDPIVLSAAVTDDQPYSGSIAWENGDGTQLGTGNPFIYEGAVAGTLTIRGKAQDKYGAESSGSVNLVVYEPVSNVLPLVNGGNLTYLAEGDDTSLTANVSFSGGIETNVLWELQQGDNKLQKTGKEISISNAELSGFSESQATLTLVISDAGLGSEAVEVFRKAFPLLITRTAVAEIVVPAEGDVFWVGDIVPISIKVTGITNPTLNALINDSPTGTTWILDSDIPHMYHGELAAALFTAEGVYELKIVVTGNGSPIEMPFSLNVYEPRVGIYVDNPPAEIDLQGDSVIVSAETAGLDSVNSIQWRSDMFAEPVAAGESADLHAIGLTPGDHSVTAEALSAEGEVIAQTTFSVKVYGGMEIQVLPVDELIIAQIGAPVILQAQAKDRDGETIAGEQVTWTSHLDGLLETGAELNLSTLEILSIGEHVFTIEAVGSYEESISILKRVLVNPAAAEEESTEDGTGDGGTPGDGGGPGGQDNGPPPPPPRTDFSSGNPFAPPPFGGGMPGMGPGGMGPGGSPVDPGLGWSGGMGGFPGGDGFPGMGGF
ncbi:MAG: hypothetical protein HQ557_04175 [Bacteroidetes bacterium]|nr:hypothetical protein [Bacteroidota bacterium]